MEKKAVFIISQAPYGREDPLGAMFMAKGLVVSFPSSIIFTGGGVHNAVKGQNPTGYFPGGKAPGFPSVESSIKEGINYGIHFYVLQKDLEARGMNKDELIEGVEPITEDKLVELLLEADATFIY